MYLNWKLTLPRVYYWLYIYFGSAVIRPILFTFDDSCYLNTFWTFPMHLSASHTTTPIIPKYLIGINVVVDCASNFFPQFCFVESYISHVCRSRDVFCIWFHEREIKLRVYLRQENKRSTPFHHADDPLFFLSQCGTRLLFSDGFFVSTFISTSAAVIPFSLSAWDFIVMPCSLHLFISLVFVIEIPVSLHHPFSLATSFTFFGSS